jgi:FkbM family methyltransferase
MGVLETGRHVLRRLNERFLLHTFALDRLDVKLRPYLRRDDAFFIEAGANDGIEQSNTLYLERYRGWRGLLVEPLPELAARCRANRPRCIVETAALVSFDHPSATVIMRDCGLMSMVKGGMKSEAEELEHLRRGSEIQKVETREIVCPARTLSAILDQHRIERVDLLSLDVEGYELNALKGLDLSRHRPRLMLVEARYRDEIDDHLRARDYLPVADLSHHDVLYRSTRT